MQALCHNSENAYVRMVAAGQTPLAEMEECLQAELSALQAVAQMTPARLCQGLEWQGFLPGFASGGVDLRADYQARIADIGKYGYGVYARNRMFYIDDRGHIVPVKHPDPIALEDLVDYELERQKLVDNTLALLSGKPAANALLTGDAGTGKSSTVKAIVNALYDRGLRVIEVRKDQLAVIPRVLDELAANPLKFILFIDDLSFAADDHDYTALKTVLEGSVAARSSNTVVYATSNRRHLIQETFQSRQGDEIHISDTREEVSSLSARFGIVITFGRPNKDLYLSVVEKLAVKAGIDFDEETLFKEAEAYALRAGGRSPRVARQYIEYKNAMDAATSCAK
jgi:predicted AAA+ superfamily ATPase